jgi:predicted transcriptional regulator
MGDRSDFERGKIVGALLAGASVTRSAALLRVSRATVSEVMSTYTDRNSGRKSILTERDRRTLRGTVSKNHTTTAAQMTGQQN